MSATKPALPEPVALIDPRGLAIGAASMHCIKRPEYRSAADAYAGVEYVSVYTADQLRAYGDARAAEALATHAKELVEAHREAFVGNIQAVSKLGLDAMDAQPLLLAVQNWDISTGRARELLRCWVLGTFKHDMLPECGEELFSETEEPREAFAKLQAEVAALRKDAERWRWLRANFGAIVVDTEWRGGPAEGRYVRSVTLNPLLGPTEPASIDAAIDAALQEQKS